MRPTQLPSHKIEAWRGISLLRSQGKDWGGFKKGSLPYLSCCGEGPVLFSLPQSQALPELGGSKEP